MMFRSTTVHILEPCIQQNVKRNCLFITNKLYLRFILHYVFYSQAESTTEWITCYYLPWMSGCRVEYNLRIIDTPGFGDCRGITRDKELVKQIEAFFTLPRDQGIDTLDAVWFVVPSPNCRLTSTQQYIFDSILAIFGKDIEENIFALITFADTDSPPALYLLNEAEIPLKGTYFFNNAALFADSKENTKYGLKVWKMSMQGFEEFFKDLKDKNIAKKSLIQTQEVLRTREELEVNISRIRRQIIEGTQEQSRMREEERVLKKHEREVADNEDFEYTVMEPKVVKIDLPKGKYALTCLKCNRSCHDDCIYADDQTMDCSAMTYDRYTKDARCGSCDNKCIWSQHKSMPYLIKLQERSVTKTYDQMKEKYFIAKEELEITTTIVEKIKERYYAVMEQNEKLVTEIKECINRLKEIALRPNPISEIEYIFCAIENEKDNRKEGYKDRVHILEELRSKAEIRKEIIDNPDIKELSISDTK